MGGSPIAGFYGKKKEKAANRAANAAGAAAMEREAEARAQKQEGLSQITAYGQQEIDATKSVDELNSLSRQLQENDKQLRRDETLIASVDPAIMEAGAQALKLLRGEKSATLAPVEAQRQSQRQALVNSLRAQFGPGAESSSIGQNALQKFDLETNSMFNQQQQSSLSQLLGTATQGRGMAQQGIQQGIGTIGQISGQYGGIAARAATAIGNVANRYNNFITNANTNILGAAGSAHVGNLLSSQASMQYYADKQSSAQADHGTMLGMFGAMAKGGG